MKNGEDMEAAHGITFSANDGEAVDVTTGEIVGQFRLAKYTAQCVVAEDGLLTVKFNVAADNDISWLSFKNVKYVANKVDISSISGSFDAVDNAKLAKGWVSADSTFVLSCPLNFLTAANLNGGWTSVAGILEDPYIGFYSNDADAYFTVAAPDGVTITSLVFNNASALSGEPTLSAEGFEPVALTGLEETITIPYNDQYAMKATITVNYTGTAQSQESPIVTGVNTVKSVAAPATIFNMAGQRVNKAVKGIYIINGQKVVK